MAEKKTNRIRRQGPRRRRPCGRPQSAEVAAVRRVAFHALASKEITRWEPFLTRGSGRGSGSGPRIGMAKGKPYTLGTVPRGGSAAKAGAHVAHGGYSRGAHTTVTCLLERLNEGTRITLRHTGFASREACINTCIFGWEHELRKAGGDPFVAGCRPAVTGGQVMLS